MTKKHIGLIFCLAAMVGCIYASSHGNFMYANEAEVTNYSLSLHRDVNKVTSSEITTGSISRDTTGGSPITFKFDGSKAATDQYSFIRFNAGNYFYNDTAISGIQKIEMRMAYGTFDVKYGSTKDSVTKSLGTYGTGANNEDLTINFGDGANYFRFENMVGNCYLRWMTITYSCIYEEEKEPLLKTAVFADVQLCYSSSGEGYKTNLGDTANAPIALKQHLQFCKDEGVDVILMNGDIANNAIEKYYEYYTDIFESVYGTDSTEYPEVIWNMGNHEWWDGNEHNTSTAVSLFNEYANIDSEYLVARSSVKYYLDNSVTLPTYYKVVEGVPFLVVSGENSTGEIGTTMQQEIADWLEDIEMLPSVQAGGAIYVLYHYPLSTTFTHGQGSIEQASVLEDLLKDYPQVVVFTGDTHFPGVNERAINQVDFTAINIGTSSYSRNVIRSATMSNSETYYNFQHNGTGSAKDIMDGQSQYQHEYTPTIHRLDVEEDYSTKINRYFTGETYSAAKNYGATWTIPANVTKATFTYTNDRFENTASAQALYGANGVSWANGSVVTYEVKDNQMTVQFPDTNEYHYTEHYKITVTGSTSKVYDCVSSYYKWYDSPINNYYVLKDLPSGDSYIVTVQAYDFFDNPSLNTLSATSPTEGTAVDTLDNALTLTYSDISRVLNVDNKTEGSGSSIEMYYKGIQAYQAGATCFRLIQPGAATDCSDYLTLGNGLGVEPVLKAKVKALSPDGVKVGVTLVIDNGSGGDKWVTDFGTEYHQTIPYDGAWHEVSWNLKTISNGAVTSKSVIHNLQIKMKSTNPNSSGYEMKALIDDIDLIDKNGDNPEPIVRGEAFNGSSGHTFEFATCSFDDNFVVDFKFTTTGYIRFMLGGENWTNYMGYFQLYSNGTLQDTYNGVTVNSLSDGYIRVTITPNSVTKFDEGSKAGMGEGIKFLYIRNAQSTANGYADINPTEGGDVIRGTQFTGGNDSTVNFTNVYALTEEFVVDFKFTSSGYVAFMIGDGWQNYYGYFEVYSTGVLGQNYNGAIIETLTDGYYRVTLDISELNKTNGGSDISQITKIDLFYIRGNWSTASGYYEIIR